MERLPGPCLRTWDTLPWLTIELPIFVLVIMIWFWTVFLPDDIMELWCMSAVC